MAGQQKTSFHKIKQKEVFFLFFFFLSKASFNKWGKTRLFKLHENKVGHLEQTHPATHLLRSVSVDMREKLGR